ncbi:MAG TPA: diguanylate cyclase [Planctomycetaceae bacterium]|jgi:diguanylate cyclase (GGDEF)-like protein|nr:diguanylate cyclase [Planctomycetaceae bacterium]
MHAKRFEELKATGALPSPTGVGLEILRLARDDQASASDIARVIQMDPALTGRTLRLANTGNAAASRPVTNVADGVSRLGTRTVGAVALGFTILAGNRSGKCRGFDYHRLWSHSLAYAVATQILCSHTKVYASADGFTAGLLAQIGRLALASIHPEQYTGVLAEWAAGSPADLVRLEQQAFVTNHNELSAAMMADWGLPQPICDAVLSQEDPSVSDFPAGSQSQQLALTLCAASRIADVCVSPSHSQAAADAPDVLAHCEAIGVDSETVLELFDRVFFQWAEWGRVLEISTQKARKLAELLEADPSSYVSAPAQEAPTHHGSLIAEPEKTVLRTDAERPEPASELLVLVADSDPSALRFLEKILALSGYRVRCATGGHEALQAFFETAPQLVIIDAALPEISGLDLCRRLRQTAAGREAYIIMLTAPGDEETLVRLFDAGVDDFITKPFSARPLFARIRASLRVVGLQERISLDRNEIQRIHAELAVAHRRLEQDALTDVLTGLPNRRYLIDRLAHDWAAARRGGTPLACMMVDIDRFKSVNDTWGHDVGDAVLRSVAGVLQREVRGTDVVCRFGGEEFVVISAADYDSAMRCAQRLRSAIEQHVVFEVNSVQDLVTVSIGVAVRSEQTRSPEALLKAADEALFCAKRSGRNRVASTRHGVLTAIASPGDDSAPPALAEALVNFER